jgi:hypothetical protein
MSETPETREQAAEAAAIRRRWITLGEVLAVIGVVISALALWNSYRERAENTADRAKTETKAERSIATVQLDSLPERDGDALILMSFDSRQDIQRQTIVFPSALGVAPVETTGNARIETGWFGNALHKARKARQRPDASASDERLPIAITTSFTAGGSLHTDVAVYELGYAAEKRLLGTAIKLKGLSLVARLPAAQAKARIDRMWAGR